MVKNDKFRKAFIWGNGPKQLANLSGLRGKINNFKPSS